MPYSPAKPLPRSATLCVGRDCAHFRHILFFLFFIFSLFFFRAAGAGSGTLKVKTLKGMLSYACSFATWNACRRSESGEWPSPLLPNLSHTVDINPESGADSDRTIFPGAAGRYSSDLIPWIPGLFLRLSPKVANRPYGRTL